MRFAAEALVMVFSTDTNSDIKTNSNVTVNLMRREASKSRHTSLKLTENAVKENI